MLMLDFSAFWIPARKTLNNRWQAVDSRMVATLLACVLILGFGALSRLTPLGLPNGDAAVYAQQIQAKDFSSRTVHLGYYLWASVLTGLQSSFPDRALNLVSAGFGAATLGLLAWIGMYLSSRPSSGVVVAVAALGHLTWVENSVWAEVYGPQTFFLIASCMAMWAGRPIWAGIALANAVLITPSSLLAVPALCLLRPDLKSVLKLGVSGSAITLLAVAPVWRDYLFGDRGLLKASGVSVDLKMAALKEGVEAVFGTFSFLPLLGFAVWSLSHRKELRPFAMVLFALWLPVFLLGERFQDVPVQLTLWALMIVAVAVGAQELERRLGATSGAGKWLCSAGIAAGIALLIPLLMIAGRRVDRLTAMPPELPGWLAFLSLAAGLWVAIGPISARNRTWILVAVLATVNLAWVKTMVGHENREIDEYRLAVLDVAQIAEPEYRVLGTWDRGILFEHYLLRKSYTDIWINPAQLAGHWGEVVQLEAEHRWQESLAKRREIWLLGPLPEQESLLHERGYVIDQPLKLISRARALQAESLPIGLRQRSEGVDDDMRNSNAKNENEAMQENHEAKEGEGG